MDGKMTKWFQSAAMYVLVFIIALLLIAIVAVVLQTLGVFELEALSVLSGLSEETGLSKESEVLTFLGIGMTGIVLMLQALIANKRAKAMEETAKAQADAARAQATANRNTERGQRQERLKNAIEHLGNESESVRLGGAYELFHLAQDTESLRHTILNILCSHIRRTTKEDTYQERYPWRPSEEIQSLLTLLFVHGHDIFTDLHVNLYGSWLNGADLREARLSGADLRRARLNKAFLGGAFLERVRFSETHLKEALLENACLREGYLFMVHSPVALHHTATCIRRASRVIGSWRAYRVFLGVRDNANGIYSACALYSPTVRKTHTRRTARIALHPRDGRALSQEIYATFGYTYKEPILRKRNYKAPTSRAET